MADELKIDFDACKIQMDANWFSEDELREKIKDMVADGDYDVAEYANALKGLTATIENSKVIEIRFPLELINNFEKESDKASESVSGVIRKALADHFKVEISIGAAAPSSSEPEEDVPPPRVTYIHREDLYVSSPQGGPIVKPVALLFTHLPQVGQPHPLIVGEDGGALCQTC